MDKVQNWAKIREFYLKNKHQYSLPDIANKFNVPYSTLYGRAKKEKWELLELDDKETDLKNMQDLMFLTMDERIKLVNQIDVESKIILRNMSTKLRSIGKEYLEHGDLDRAIEKVYPQITSDKKQKLLNNNALTKLIALVRLRDTIKTRYDVLHILEFLGRLERSNVEDILTVQTVYEKDENGNDILDKIVSQETFIKPDLKREDLEFVVSVNQTKSGINVKMMDKKIVPRLLLDCNNLLLNKLTKHKESVLASKLMEIKNRILEKGENLSEENTIEFIRDMLNLSREQNNLKRLRDEQ